MPTQKITIPASKTPQTLIITLPDAVTFGLTGGTPLDPPVVTPPAPPPISTGLLSGYSLVYESTFQAVKEIDPFAHNQFGSDSINNHFDTINGNPAPSFKSKPTGNVSAGVRSEIDLTEKTITTEGALSVDIMINVPVWNNGHILQWHPSTKGGSASPGLWYDGVNTMLWNNWDAATGKNQGHACSWIPALKKFQNHIILHKFGLNGYLRHYVDNVLVASWDGQVGEGNGTPYLKVGYNGWDGNSLSSDINYDNIRIYKLG